MEDRPCNYAVGSTVEFHPEPGKLYDCERAVPEGTEPIGRLVCGRERELPVTIQCNDLGEGAYAENAGAGFTEHRVHAVA